MAEVSYCEHLNHGDSDVSPAAAAGKVGSKLRISDEVDAASWDAYVDGHQHATIYHTSAWRNIVQNTFGKQTFYFAALGANDEVCGVLPLIRQKSLILGDRLVSVPYCNYGGALSDTPDIAARLAQEAIDLGSRLRSSNVELRGCQEPAGDSMDLRTDKVRMILTLPETSDELGKALGSKRRSQIRRSQRNDPQTRHGGMELVRDFYSVFCRNMRDLGTPVYPLRLFENVVNEWPDNTFITVIYIDGKPVASAFLIAYRDMLEIPWASSLREYNSISVNMLLYWEVLQFAIDREFRFFDFGRCTKNEGTYRFKKQWGTVEEPLHWQTYSKGNDATKGNSSDSNAKQIVANIWRRLPLRVANFVGPRITSNLPW